MIMFTPEAIKQLRESLRLSQRQFSREMGVNVSTVSRWEAGELHPRYKMIVAMNQMADSRKRARR